MNLFRPGKDVVADATPADVTEAYPGVSPPGLLEFAATGRLRTMLAGPLGANAHFVNGVVATYIACGQDIAQIVNACIGALGKQPSSPRPTGPHGPAGHT